MDTLAKSITGKSTISSRPAIPTSRHSQAALRVLLMVCMAVSTGTSGATRYSSGWDDGWRHVHEHGHAYGNCWLELRVPGYGEARFVRGAGGSIGFEFQAALDLQHGPIEIALIAPAWHPGHPSERVLGTALHVQGGGALLHDELARPFFIALRDGYEAELRGHQRAGGTLVIHLSAINADAAMRQFMACLEPVVQVSWRELARSRVSYPVDGYALDAASQRTLEQIAGYLQADHTVKHVYIDGHTDASGTERGNAQLAKRRAQGVADYLRARQLPQNLVVRYHGARYPVADNATTAGKARNRRTTVRLSRSDENLHGVAAAVE